MDYSVSISVSLAPESTIPVLGGNKSVYSYATNKTDVGSSASTSYAAANNGSGSYQDKGRTRSESFSIAVQTFNTTVSRATSTTTHTASNQVYWSASSYTSSSSSSTLIPVFSNSIATLSNTTTSIQTTSYTFSSANQNTTVASSTSTTTSSSAEWHSYTYNDTYYATTRGDSNWAGASESRTRSRSGVIENGVDTAPTVINTVDLYDSVYATITHFPQDDETIFFVKKGGGVQSTAESFSYTQSKLRPRFINGSSVYGYLTTSSFTSSQILTVTAGISRTSNNTWFTATKRGCPYELGTAISDGAGGFTGSSTEYTDALVSVYGRSGPYVGQITSISDANGTRYTSYTVIELVQSTAKIAGYPDVFDEGIDIYYGRDTYMYPQYLGAVGAYNSFVVLAENTAGYCDPTLSNPSPEYESWSPNLVLSQKHTNEYHIGDTNQRMALFNHFLGAPLPILSSTSTSIGTASSSTFTFTFTGNGQGESTTGYMGLNDLVASTGRIRKLYNYKTPGFVSDSFRMSEPHAVLTPYEGVSYSLAILEFPWAEVLYSKHSLFGLWADKNGVTSDLSITRYLNTTQTISVDSTGFKYIQAYPRIDKYWDLFDQMSFDPNVIILYRQSPEYRDLHMYNLFQMFNAPPDPIYSSAVYNCDGGGGGGGYGGGGGGGGYP